MKVFAFDWHLADAEKGESRGFTNICDCCDVKICYYLEDFVRLPIVTEIDRRMRYWFCLLISGLLSRENY